MSVGKHFLSRTLADRSIGEKIYHKLRGFICLYKPPDVDNDFLRDRIKHLLVKGINRLPCRPVEEIPLICSSDKKMSVKVINKADTVQGK